MNNLEKGQKGSTNRYSTTLPFPSCIAILSNLLSSLFSINPSPSACKKRMNPNQIWEMIEYESGGQIAQMEIEIIKEEEISVIADVKEWIEEEEKNPP